MERYLHGPIPGATSEHLSSNEVAAVCRDILNEYRQWQGARQSSTTLVSPAASVGALGELSPGGALMRGFQEQSLARTFKLMSLWLIFFRIHNYASLIL